MNQEIKDKLIQAGYKGEFGLSEFIEACGNNFQKLMHTVKDITVGISGTGISFWRAIGGINYTDMEGEGTTPEEAVANLWIALNKKNE